MKDEIALLKNSVLSYEGFCQVAVDLEWFELDVQHEDWYCANENPLPLGMYVDVFIFPDQYLQKHFCEAYVRAVLSSMAIYEEWDKDF